MKKSSILIIIGVVLVVAAAVQFYLAYDAHDAIRMNQNAYEIAVAAGNPESMGRLRGMMEANEIKSHVYLSSGIVSIVVAVGLFIANAKLKRRE